MGAFVHSFPCLASSRDCPQPGPAVFGEDRACPQPQLSQSLLVWAHSCESQLPSLGSSGRSGPCSLLQAGKLMSRDIAERLLTLSCYCKNSASPVETEKARRGPHLSLLLPQPLSGLAGPYLIFALYKLRPGVQALNGVHSILCGHLPPVLALRHSVSLLPPPAAEDKEGQGQLGIQAESDYTKGRVKLFSYSGSSHLVVGKVDAPK